MTDVVVLLSGGLDSTTLCHLAMKQGRLHSVVSAYYGQPAAMWEQHAAGEWAKKHGVQREVLHLTLPGANAMDLGAGESGPRVAPGRNLVLVAHAVAHAAAIGAREVWIGACADDYVDYADCRGGFVRSVSDAAGAYGVRVVAPLASHTKRGVVGLARTLGVDIAATWSCYQPGRSPEPCGTCAACVLRASTLADAPAGTCPRCGATPGQPCHAASGYGADHVERRSA